MLDVLKIVGIGVAVVIGSIALTVLLVWGGLLAWERWQLRRERLGRL